ncbi:hypothetical protein PF005_g27900 [Phytophthora fragariae]|uniref:Uncharacterized protein n=1 Tax=Phytophthora fragariae TaxID=53985 RepID=A0A6A4BEC2_9STRA|nr:hypothetical protein PF003_g39176 [Phytophthora fragariae]KAE8921228.1 hypothetical protein PF009_g28490 [Phytophthora fragariae]KAE8969061.1 hypothetical protein PF011_g26949 [Phytophthora fragariae]KAE9067353.1 hypothetical protein PF010_g27495 [Phytophthora fragariae]KAE9068139.1 hypothetical protein PF007_g27807 [Phytophthora fragariae]
MPTRLACTESTALLKLSVMYALCTFAGHQNGQYLLRPLIKRIGSIHCSHCEVCSKSTNFVGPLQCSCNACNCTVHVL